MKKPLRSFSTIIFLFTILLGRVSFSVYASTSVGSINPTHHVANVCEDILCSVTLTSPINFGYFTSTPGSNVIITNTELRGFIWGKAFGWVVLNCSNTTSGCTTLNASFKVKNDINGHLSGYAWGENSGWIHFGPFSQSSTTPVTINNSGEFNGYAWSQNYGWIKFDCTNMNYCVRTDWRPNNNNVNTYSSSGGYPECSDRVDNDRDGLIDYPSDPGCTDPRDTSENTAPLSVISSNDKTLTQQPLDQTFCMSNPTQSTCNPHSSPLYCSLHPESTLCAHTPIRSIVTTTSSIQNSIQPKSGIVNTAPWLQRLKNRFMVWDNTTGESNNRNPAKQIRMIPVEHAFPNRPILLLVVLLCILILFLLRKRA